MLGLMGLYMLYGGADLWGKRVPSVDLEKVPYREIMGQVIFDDHQSAIRYHSDKKPIYRDLFVRKSAIRLGVKYVKGGGT